MEDNKRKKPARKPENPMREWISDNLRYIMLFGGIALAVIIIAVAVRMFAGTDETTDNSSQSVSDTSVTSEIDSSSDTEDSSSNTEDETDEVSEESESSSSEVSESESSSSETSEPESSETETDQNSSAEQETEETLTDAGEDVSGVVTSYMNALVSGDADAAASVLESITDEDRTAIAQGVYANSYNNFAVYSYPGDTDGSYVAFVRYEYTYPGYSTPVPALTQFYVFTRDDGSLCIASEATQQAKADYLNSILTREDVAQLVSEVQGAYDAALASDPALAEYINSISQ